MRSCDHKENIAAYLLMSTFRTANENTAMYNPANGSKFAWIFRILICVLKDNGYTPVLNFKRLEITTPSTTITYII
jgi:hypothetical protein